MVIAVECTLEYEGIICHLRIILSGVVIEPANRLEFLAAHIKIGCQTEKLALETLVLGHGRL